MKRNQLTITYLKCDASELHRTLKLLKRRHHINLSAFCREAIAEKLGRLEEKETLQ